jgi:subtilase family serine protease
MEAMAGTSMATPVTAGTAALIRQYFADRYYVNQAITMSYLASEYFTEHNLVGDSLVDNCMASFTCNITRPSGALVKVRGYIV